MWKGKVSIPWNEPQKKLCLHVTHHVQPFWYFTLKIKLYIFKMKNVAQIERIFNEGEAIFDDNYCWPQIYGSTLEIMYEGSLKRKKKKLIFLANL